MDQVIEFFQKLFDASDWPPRWYCGEWSEFHGWFYIFSDMAIWLAYFIIPMIIIWFVQRRPIMPFLPIVWLFGIFILFCGATHAMDAVLFWWPAYRLSGLIRFVTAIISMITIFVMIRDLPKLLASQEVAREEDKDLLRKKELEIDQLKFELSQLKKQFDENKFK